MTFKSTGDVTITGKLRSGVKTSCQLHIRNTEDIQAGPVTDLIPGSDSLTLKPGEYGQNPITLDPNTDYPVFSYESSDDEVAMVDDVGVIHAISPGTCLIKVTEEDSDVETSFTVVVEDNSEEVAGLKAKLTEYVTSASRDLATGKYTADTVKALKKRIAEANDVIDDRTATVRDIDIAQVRLLRAWRLLEPVDQAAEDADRILHEEINALASVSKSKFKKYFKVNAKNGKITVKKGLKKGAYTVKVKVSKSGNVNYLPAAKTAKVIVKVK